MKTVVLLLGGGYIGWWLAMNKAKETRALLAQAELELDNIHRQVSEQINENDESEDFQQNFVEDSTFINDDIDIGSAFLNDGRP